LKLDNSSFENEHNQLITPENASNIISLIYQSAHHNVYKIKINNRWMFLKRIIASQKNNPIYIENLQREFEIGFTLDHPGIVSYFNYGIDSEGNYLLTEFIDGKMLREYLAKQKPSIEFIHSFIIQLLDILSYLEKRNIYHLDLKPENILISTKNQQIKLIDFGMAHSDMYTKTPSGTLKYAAPEMFLNPKNCNAASDIYSIGVILLELFTSTTDRNNLNKIPFLYRKIIARCLKEKQEDRFQQYQDLIQAFKNTKKRTSQLLLIPFIVVLLVITEFLLIHKPNKSVLTTNSNKEYINQRVSIPSHKLERIKNQKSINVISTENSEDLKKSKKDLDSLNSNLKKWFNNKSTKLDSLKICELGDSIFKVYQIKLTEAFSVKSYRPKKMIQIELQRTCLEEFEKIYQDYISKFDKHSLRYFESLHIFGKKQKNLREKFEVL
jgi:serine/threonine protein kinase